MTQYVSRWGCPRRIIGPALAATLATLVLGSGRAEAELLIGVTTTNVLETFDSATPGTIVTAVGVTGLQGGEALLGIDFRPADRVLYGLGSTSRLYTINTTTGVATQVRQRGRLHAQRYGLRLRLQPDGRPNPRHQRHRPEPAARPE
jgi:hypothetical protein